MYIHINKKIRRNEIKAKNGSGGNPDRVVEPVF